MPQVMLVSEVERDW